MTAHLRGKQSHTVDGLHHSKYVQEPEVWKVDMILFPVVLPVLQAEDRKQHRNKHTLSILCIINRCFEPRANLRPSSSFRMLMSFLVWASILPDPREERSKDSACLTLLMIQSMYSSEDTNPTIAPAKNTAIADEPSVVPPIKLKLAIDAINETTDVLARPKEIPAERQLICLLKYGNKVSTKISDTIP
jgi:hypothetical protein